MSSRRIALATAAVAIVAALAGPSVQARGADVQWSVTIGAPVITVPAPVVTWPVPAPVVVAPAPRPHVVHLPPARTAYPDARYGHYREPTRWDVDGDGIPNRHDPVYNPVWDRNGNGVPDRREFRHGPYGDRDRDGIPNRYDRHDDRYGDRYGDRYDHQHRGWHDGRGPR